MNFNRFLQKLVIEESRFLPGNANTYETYGPSPNAQVAHQGSQLRKIFIRFEFDEDYYNTYTDADLMNTYTGPGLTASILDVAQKLHELQDLTLGAEGPAWVPGIRQLLPQLLKETKSLQKLHILGIRPTSGVAAGLAGGLGENKSLRKLVVGGLLYMEVADVCMILDSLVENQTLQYLDARDEQRRPSPLSPTRRGMHDSDASQAICESLLRLFRQNKSLRHIGIPRLDLRGQPMRMLL